MNYTEREINRLYRTLDFDPDRALEFWIQNNLRRKNEYVRKRLWWKACLSAACLALVFLGIRHITPQEPARVVRAPAWLLKQADFSAYESPDGELLVSYELRGRR